MTLDIEEVKEITQQQEESKKKKKITGKNATASCRFVCKFFFSFSFA
jgi:hypothetical protein